MATLKTAIPTLFKWESAFNNNYRFSNGSDLCGFLSVSREPALPFETRTYDFYKARADADGRRYFFNCVFWNGLFRGCSMQEEDGASPVAVYREYFLNFRWCHRGRIALQGGPFPWEWVRNRRKGAWIVRSGEQRFMEIHSPTPRTRGTVRLCSPPLLGTPHLHGLMLFCVYLAMGPKRYETPRGHG